MKNLEQYVEQKNYVLKLFGGRVLDINDAFDRKQIAIDLDCDISPENISCDGERSASEVRRLAKFYRAVAQELKQLDGDVNFQEPSLLGIR